MSKLQITQEQAVAIFGSREAMVKAMGCTSQAPYRWPDPLSIGLTQRVIGAAWLLGRVRQINKVLGG